MTAERRRPARLRRYVLRPAAWSLALLAILAFAAVQFVRSAFLAERARVLLLARLEEYLGRRITAESVTLAYFPFTFEVRDLVVPGPEAGDPPVAVVPRLIVEANLRGLRDPVLTLREVRLERPRLYVELAPDGSHNLPRPRARGGGRRRLDLKIDALTVAGGVLEVAERRLPLDLEARGVQARLLGGGGLRLQGRVVAQEVRTTLPNARPYAATVAGAVTIDRDRLELTNGRVVGPDLQARVEGEVRWLAGERAVDLSIDATGTSELFRRLGYVEDQVAGPWRWVGGFQWRPEAWGYRGQLTSEAAVLLGRRLTGLHGELAGDRHRVRVDVDRAAYHGGLVRGSLVVEVQDPDRPAELDLEFTDVAAAPLLADQEIPVTAVAGRASGSFHYDFTFDDPLAGSGHADVAVAPAPPAGGEIALAGTVPLAIERGVLSSEAIRLRSAEHELFAHGSYDLRRAAGSFDFRVATTDVGDLAVLLPPPEPGEPPALWLPTAGRGELAGTLHLGAGGPAADLRFDLSDVRTPGVVASSARGALRVDERWVEDLRLELARPGGAVLLTGRVPIEGTEGLDAAVEAASWPLAEARPWLPAMLQELPVGGDFTGEVALRGAIETPTGRVDGVVERASWSGVELGQLRATIAFDPRDVTIESFVLEAPAGRLDARGRLGVPDERLDLVVAAPGLDLGAEPLRGLLGGELEGEASLQATIGGTLAAPAVHAGVAAHGLGLRGRPLGSAGQAELTVDWDGARATARGSLLGLVEIEGGGPLDTERADLALQVRSSDLPALVDLLVEATLPEFSGSFDGVVSVRGPLGAPAVELRLDRLEALYEGRLLANREPVLLRLDGGAVEVVSLYLGEPASDSELFLGGRVVLGEDPRLDLRLQATLAAAWLELAVPSIDVEGWFDALATIRGTVSRPEVSGQGGLRDARLILAGFPHAFDDLRGLLLVYPGQVVVDGLQARLGGGTLQATGTIALPGAEGAEAAGTYRLQATARDVTLRYPEGWLLRGGADLTLLSTEGGRQVRGVVDLDRAYYLRDVQVGITQLLRAVFARQRLEVGETDEVLASTQLNVALRVAPGALRVRNNLANLRGTADLALRGSAASPVVFGRVEMEPGGTLVYAENEYEVERAVLTFANPYRIEPFVDLVARTEVSRYDVTLNLAGPLDRLSATFASDPPIADLDIFGLLATGEAGGPIADVPGEEREAERSFGAESFLYGQAASLIGQRVNTLFGFDKFRVAPIASGGESISSVRVTVGKRLSRDVFVTYSVDPSATEEQHLTVEWQVGDELALVFTQNGDGSYSVEARWERRL